MKKIILSVIVIIYVCSVFGFSFGTNKIQPKKVNWTRLETKHFDVYYKKGNDDFGKIAALMSENTYYYLNKDFKIPIQHRIPIIFYNSQREFSTTNIIYPILSEGVAGFTEKSQNRVVVPFDGSYKKLEEVLTHEMTHAYINDLNTGIVGNKFFNSSLNSLPFWFQEGLPEYESVGGTKKENEMYLQDMTLNNHLYDLSAIGGFYAYRMGESFLVYLKKTYSRKKVMEFYFNTRTNHNLDINCEKVFGMKFKEIQRRWRDSLKKRFLPEIANYSFPYEKTQRLTNHEEDGSTFNFAPKFSPNGKKYVYFSNRKMHTSIWLGDAYNLIKPKMILKGETTPDFESFHYNRNELCWLPDNVTIAFVASNFKNDRIYFFNTFKKEITNVIDFPNFTSIYEMDISHDGNKIAFSAQKNDQVNLFIYNLQTKKISQITNDFYEESQPKWSKNDDEISFTGERPSKYENENHIFYDLSKQIYIYNLKLKQFSQITFDKEDNHSSFWVGDSLAFITEAHDFINYDIINLKNSTRAKLTNFLTGVLDADCHKNKILYSVFYDNGWDIYLDTDLKKNLDWRKYDDPHFVDFNDNFYQRYSLDRYKYVGRDIQAEKAQKKARKIRIYHPKKRSRFDMDITQDSLFYANSKLNDKKQNKINIPRKFAYKPRYHLDQFMGGLAYNSSAGTIGMLQLSMSDLLGNNAFALRTDINGKLKDSNIIINYLYLANRIDYGIGLIHTSDETIYRYTINNQYEYFRSKDIKFGLYGMLRYPFNKFWRADTQFLLYSREMYWDYWDTYYGIWHNIEKEKDYLFEPAISLVHDNTIYGITGPIDGWRSFIQLTKSFSKENYGYSTIYSDSRFYKLFEKRYSFASRLILGGSFGKNPQTFRLDGFNGVRGYSKEIEKRKKMLLTLELRYPFIDVLKMGFPLPITLTNIRGGIFTDMGALWDKDKNLRFSENGELKDLKMGIGFGPRMNLGMFILHLDVAWKVNFVSQSSPTYYMNLMQDF